MTCRICDWDSMLISTLVWAWLYHQLLPRFWSFFIEIWAICIILHAYFNLYVTLTLILNVWSTPLFLKLKRWNRIVSIPIFNLHVTLTQTPLTYLLVYEATFELIVQAPTVIWPLPLLESTDNFIFYEGISLKFELCDIV